MDTGPVRYSTAAYRRCRSSSEAGFATDRVRERGCRQIREAERHRADRVVPRQERRPCITVSEDGLELPRISLFSAFTVNNVAGWRSFIALNSIYSRN